MAMRSAMTVFLAMGRLIEGRSRWAPVYVNYHLWYSTCPVLRCDYPHIGATPGRAQLQKSCEGVPVLRGRQLLLAVSSRQEGAVLDPEAHVSSWPVTSNWRANAPCGCVLYNIPIFLLLLGFLSFTLLSSSLGKQKNDFA